MAKYNLPKKNQKVKKEIKDLDKILVRLDSLVSYRDADAKDLILDLHYGLEYIVEILMEK